MMSGRESGIEYVDKVGVVHAGQERCWGTITATNNDVTIL